MDLQLTTKSQEALAGAVRRAATAGQAQVEPLHLLGTLLAQGSSGDGIADRRARPRRRRPRRAHGVGRRRARRAAVGHGPDRAVPAALARDLPGHAGRARRGAKERGDEFVSTEHLLVGLAQQGGPGVSDVLAAAGATPAALVDAISSVRQRPGHQRRPRADLPGAREVRRRPHRARARGQDRPRHRARRRDPPRRAGAVAGGRRTTPCSSASPASARPPSSRGSRSASSTATSRTRCAASGSSRSTSRRCSPARSTAASSRSGSSACSTRSRAATARSSPSSTSCTPSSARARAATPRWTPATCSSRCSPAASCAWSARPRSTSTASGSRRTRRSSAASSRCSSGSRRVEDTVAILRGIKEKYEAHHKVAIADSALVAAATLSDRYITQPLPARQGDRPRRRGRVAAAHGDRLLARWRSTRCSVRSTG